MTDPATDSPVENAWTKLRRRKVVQWGIAYAAGAWGFLQGLAYISTLLDWPAHLQKLTGLALLIGLPIVLVIAWYHGDRGEQRVTRVELAIVTLLFLIGGGLFWRYHSVSEPQLEASTSSASSEPAETIADPRPSIAVLPFDNRSAKHDDTYFVDGIHDDILTQLSKVSGMRVISRTSVEQFRDTKLPIKSIAEQLGVAQILEGGVQRAGDRVRVTVQLIDASTDAHLWAENYDRELTAANIFAIQSEVATAIAAALKATLTADEKTRLNAIPTQNLEAWEAYQLGRQRMVNRTTKGLAEAENFFRKSIELDAGFALAYSGLADALTLQVDYSGKPKSWLTDAERWATKALEVNPNLAEAWASRGNIEMSRAQYAAAEEHLRRAVDLNPNYAQAQHWLSLALANAGKPEEAQKHAEIAIQLDPLSPVLNLRLGSVLESRGRFEEAARRYGRAIEIDPSMPGAYHRLAALQAWARNRFGDAVRLVEKAIALDPDNPAYSIRLAELYLDLGDSSQVRRLVTEAEQRWPTDLKVNATAAYVSILADDRNAAARYANTMLADYPQHPDALLVLRNIDLERRDYRSARDRYAAAFPELLGPGPLEIDESNYSAAIDLVPVLRGTGEGDRAVQLLDSSEKVISALPRRGYGYLISDVQIHALRGDKAKALAALREAEQAGWRGPVWRYDRDFNPNLASIRDEPEFKAVFADIERDMARQRAALAARPKGAPLELGSH